MLGLNVIAGAVNVVDSGTESDIRATDPSGEFAETPVQFTITSVEPPTTPPGTLFVNSKNAHGGDFISGITRLFDPQETGYLWARITNRSTLQLTSMVESGGRSSRIPNFRAINDDNPLFMGIFHMSHWGDYPAYRKNSSQFDRYVFDYWSNNPRIETIIHIDSDNVAVEINGNDKPASAFGAAGVLMNCNELGMRTHIANAAHDVLSGGDLAEYFPAMSGDISDFCVWFNDSTSIRNPKSNINLIRIQNNGQVVSVDNFDSSDGTRVTLITIDSQPSDPINNQIFFFNGNEGFIGYEVETAQNVSGGNAQLGLHGLPGPAGTQTQVPQAGWRYSLNNDPTQTTTVDWNADGTPTGIVESATQWTPGWDDYWDLINQKILASTGHESGRGWNGAQDWVAAKSGDGWTTPHEFTEKSDYCLFENASSSQWRYSPESNSGPHEYDINGVDMEHVMFSTYFAATGTITSPNSFMENKPRGLGIETNVWGNNYDDQNELDASLIRFHLAFCRTIPDLVMAAGHTTTGTPVMIEEWFIDFDTDWVTPDPIGVFREDDGSSGSNGPLGDFVYATADWGLRGYFRRYGNYLCAMNMSAFPGGYGNFYNPSHLPGGFTPRAGDDEITSTDFSNLVPNGFLNEGEELRHYNPASYFNQAVTTFLRDQNPSHWNGFVYGPRQAHPNDGDGAYTVANTPVIARDDILNDGSAVNQGASYFLGPSEAVFWEIV